MMLLARRITKHTEKDSAIYRLLSFYIKSHFKLDNVAISDYIGAIVNKDISTLIKGLLAYNIPAPYKTPDYDQIAATLISA